MFFIIFIHVLRGKKYAEEHGIELVMLRPSVMLGPGDVRFRSTHIILQYIDGKVPITPTGGYSFVDVRDVAMGKLQREWKKRKEVNSKMIVNKRIKIDFFIN